MPINRRVHRDGNGTALRVEVDNLIDDVHSLRSEIRSIQGTMSTRQDMDQLSAQLGSLAARIEERSRPQWNILISLGILLVTVLTAIGTLAYLPILRSVDENKIAITKIGEYAAERLMSRAEFEKYQDGTQKVFS